MKYCPIIDLRIRHAYYADGRCADFAVEPDAETQRLLAGCRCVVHGFPDGIRVSTPTTDDGSHFAPLPAGKSLGFHLRLKNADFRLFTDLTEFRDHPAPLFTTAGAGKPASGRGRTAAPPQVLALSTVTATRTERLVFPAGAIRAGFTLGGLPGDKVAPAQYQLAGLDEAAAVKSRAKGQKLTVNASRSPEARSFTVSYPVRPQLPPGVFARVEIVWESPAAAVATTLKVYEIRFNPLPAKWRYYLVSPPASICEYSVDFGRTATFEPSTPDAADPVGQALQAQFGATARVDCFTSEVPLLSGDAAPAGLRLMKGDEGEPLPSPRSLCHLGDNTPAFFRIVRKT